ncbi:TonB-dependent receptor plug domain-containing protein [Marinobacter oulmenensis]|uniref:Hemoglobin/transferrin/lactoferrin receptor protein n=1 Tax=Marinobacter oulmenensis TaxID=643747 RepID=A0A840UFZ3_9GAMM|nr:TonB-dependent receptor [Marinobacter oulmenensis]MBB5320076.1 hemoglobin/transferrin/lactoferrin receptor protein [Marinobacter oulmenensis]
MPYRPQTLNLTALLLSTIMIPVASADESQLQELVVTAKGYEADTLETASAAEQITTESAAASKTTGDLFRGRPGLAVQGDGGAWGGNPVIRGLKKESVVMLVDGVRLNSAQPQGAIASLASMSLLDTVEVVKGPASVLHGTGAMGGAINLRTPQARFSEKPQAKGRFSGSTGTVDSSLAGGALLELSSQDHGLVLGAAAKDVDDYETPDGDVENSGFRSNSFLAKYAYRVTENQKLTINLQNHEDRDVWYPGSAKSGPGGNGTLTIHSPKQERTLMELGYEAALAGGTLETSVYRQEVDRQIRAWWDFQNRNQVWNDVTFRTDGIKAQYRFPVGESHLITLGADAWEMTGDPQRFTYNPPMSNSVIANSPFRDGEIESRGLFVQDDIHAGKWNFQIGARYDKVTGDASVVGNGPAAQTQGLENTAETLSWSTGAIYNASPMLNPYISLGTAYRAPDMRERFEDASRGDGYFHRGNSQLDPEKSTTAEIGLKGRGQDAQYQVAAFYTRIDDYIAGRVTGQNHPQNGLPIKQTENLDEVIIYGIEAGFLMPLESPQIDMDGSLTWLRGENKQDNEPLYQMPAPELTLGLGEQNRAGFNWHGQVRAVAEQDRTADRFSNGTENTTPGYATLDMELGWNFGAIGRLSSLEVSVEGNNLLDKRYREHLTDGDILSPGRGLVAKLSGTF